MRSSEPLAGCADDHCVTCGDVAEPMRVLRVGPARGLGLCEDAGGARHTIELALVDAGVGDDVLVHAGTAIAGGSAALGGRAQPGRSREAGGRASFSERGAGGSAEL